MLFVSRQWSLNKNFKLVLFNASYVRIKFIACTITYWKCVYFLVKFSLYIGMSLRCNAKQLLWYITFNRLSISICDCSGIKLIWKYIRVCSVCTFHFKMCSNGWEQDAMPTGTAVVVIYYFEITFSCIFLCIIAKMHTWFWFIRLSLTTRHMLLLQ